MLRHYGTAAGNGIVENEVAAGGMIQSEAIPLQKADDMPWLNGG